MNVFSVRMSCRKIKKRYIYIIYKHATWHETWQLLYLHHRQKLNMVHRLVSHCEISLKSQQNWLHAATAQTHINQSLKSPHAEGGCFSQLKLPGHDPQKTIQWEPLLNHVPLWVLLHSSKKEEINLPFHLCSVLCPSSSTYITFTLIPLCSL